MGQVFLAVRHGLRCSEAVQDAKMTKFLQQRAWIIAILLNLGKCILMLDPKFNNFAFNTCILGEDSDKELPEECPDYDRGIINAFVNAQITGPIVPFVISTLLCFACYKYPKLSHSFIYVESLQLMFVLSRPSPFTKSEHQTGLLALLFLVTFQFFAMRNTAHVVFAAACVSVQLFVVEPVIFLRHNEVGDVFYHLLVLFIFVVLCCSLILACNYVARLQRSLQTASASATLLLDNLHDGILILSKAADYRQVLGHNRQAKKLVHRLILRQPGDLSRGSANLFEQADFVLTPAFKPIAENQNNELRELIKD